MGFAGQGSQNQSMAQSRQPEEDDSEDDDEFLANVEELPDTDELEDDEQQAEDSEEQLYEPETDVLHLGADGASVASGTPAEVLQSTQVEEQSRSKRRRLSAGTPASDATAPPAALQDNPQLHAVGSAADPASHMQEPLHTQQPSQGLVPMPPPRAQTLPQQLPMSQQQSPGPKQQQVQPQKQHGHAEHGHYQHSMQHPKKRHKLPQQHQQMQALQPAVNAVEQGSFRHPGHAPRQLPHSHTNTRPQAGTPAAGSELATSPSIAATESASIQQDDEGGTDAICLRTRSKHPLASEEFDPDMFDRLLAEFDPDVEPLIDDAMYQQFLQSLQNEGPTGNQLPLDHSSLLSPRPFFAAPLNTTATTAAPPSASLPAGGPTGAPAAGMAGFIDDDDDEEYQLDPLDWLLDDERDAKEEERLAQLVQVQTGGSASNKRAAIGSAAQQAAAQTPSRLSQGLPGQHEGLGDRRRSQREAARRAAERIAQEQQMLMQQQQQLLQQGLAPAAGYVQPLIPATFAGWPVSAGLVDHPGAALPLQHVQQPEQLMPTVPAPPANPGLSAAVTGAELGMTAGDQQEQYVDPTAAAAAAIGTPEVSMPQLLTLTDNQLKQLYHQVSLHTQLLTQLYVLTARDPSPAAQAVASAAGQMLGEVKQLHAAATGSYRGGQLGELLQQAFCETSSGDGEEPGNPGAAADAAAGAHASSRRNGWWAPNPRVTAATPYRIWRPPITDMGTIWDSAPLRLLDDVVAQLRVSPMCDQPLLELLQLQEAGSGRNSGNSSRATQQAAKSAKQMVDVVLGPTCKGSGAYDESAWPVVAPRGKPGLWGAAEDDLLWLGIIRFHNAVRPLQSTAELIIQELLPSKSTATILHRYKNLVRRRNPTAELVLKYALIGKERPTAWSNDEQDDQQGLGEAAANPNPSQAQQGSAGVGSVSGRSLAAATPGDNSGRASRGPMWAAAELGAALTAAFAAVELGLPSAAAAAAAGVLLQGPGGSSSDSLGAAAVVDSSGEQLLQDLVASVSARLPFVLPAPLEVPSANSIRKPRIQHSLYCTADPAAGQQLLLSLAARQILHGDMDPATGAAAAGSGGGPDAAGASEQGLLAGLFPAGNTGLARQQPPPPSDSRDGSEAAIGPYTALLQASPAPVRTRSPAAARALSPAAVDPAPAAVDAAQATHQAEQQAAAPSDRAAEAACELVGSATGIQQQQHDGGSKPRQQRAVSQPTLQPCRQHQEQHLGPQQKCVHMIGGSLAHPFSAQLWPSTAGPGNVNDARLSGPQPFGSPAKPLKSTAVNQRSSSAAALVQGGRQQQASRIQQSQQRGRATSEPALAVMQTGIATMAASSPAVRSITVRPTTASPPAGVATDNDDMDFGSPDSASKPLQHDQHDAVAQLQSASPGDVGQHLQLREPGEVSTAAAIAAYAAASRADASSNQAAVGGNTGVSAASADGGKQLRRSLFGPGKPAAAAGLATAREAGGVTSAVTRQQPGPVADHLPSPPAAAAAVTAASRPATAPPAPARTSTQRSIMQPTEQCRAQPAVIRPAAASRQTVATNKFDVRSQSVFSASGISAAAAGSAAIPVHQQPAIAGCVGIGLNLHSWPGPQVPQAGKAGKPPAVSGTANKSSAAMRAAGSIIGLSRAMPDSDTSKRRASRVLQQPGVVPLSGPPTMEVIQPAMAVDTSALRGQLMAAVPSVKESVSARAARRLAEAQALDTAVVAAAAATAASRTQQVSAPAGLQQQTASGNQSRRKGRRRRTNVAPLNGFWSVSPAAAGGILGAAGASSSTAIGVAAQSGQRSRSGLGLPAGLDTGDAGQADPQPPATSPTSGAATGASAIQATQANVQLDSLVATLRSVLQLPTAGHTVVGQQPAQGQGPDQGRVSLDLPSMRELQLFVHNLQQRVSSGSSQDEVNIQALYAAVARQQQQPQQDEQQPVQPHQQPERHRSQQSRAIPADVEKQIGQPEPHKQGDKSSARQSKEPQLQPVGLSRRMHHLQQHSQAMEATALMDFSALQALAEAAAKAARRTKK